MAQVSEKESARKAWDEVKEGRDAARRVLSHGKKYLVIQSFDENGEKILTTYDNEYSAMMMDIRVYRMKAGETRSFRKEGEETAVLLLAGKIVFRFDGQEKEVSRKDVFTEGPWAVHVCTGQEVSVEAVTEAEILVQSTKNEKDFAANCNAPEDAPWGYSVWASSEMWPREG